MRTSEKSTKNRVYAGNGSIIRAEYHGEQTSESLHNVIKKLLSVIKIKIEKNEPVMLLMDIRDLKGFDQAARLVDMHARTILPFWKMAFITDGNASEGEAISRQLTLMSGRKKEIRYFVREDDALGWLSFMRDERVSLA